MCGMRAFSAPAFGTPAGLTDGEQTGGASPLHDYFPTSYNRSVYVGEAGWLDGWGLEEVKCRGFEGDLPGKSAGPVAPV